MWYNTKATQLLGLKYPIIQGPFGGNLSSTKLVSRVSNLGGMGSFGLNSYNHDEILNIDKEIKSLTSNPYALNLWVPLKNDPVKNYTKEQFNQLKEVFSPLFKRMDIPLPDLPHPKPQDFDNQIEAVLKSKPPAQSFIFGIPDNEILKALKKANILTIGTATSAEEALAIKEAKMDLIVASGKEAGGHRASFLKPADKNLLSTSELLTKLNNKLDIPVIAAGGISDSKSIYNAIKLGASAVQIGTAFLATKESNASPLHKKKLLSGNKLNTTLTKVFTGRLARALENNFSDEFEQHQKLFAPYPIQSSFLSALRKAFLENNQTEKIAFWSGQPSSILKYDSTELLFNSFIDELDEIFNNEYYT